MKILLLLFLQIIINFVFLTHLTFATIIPLTPVAASQIGTSIGTLSTSTNLSLNNTGTFSFDEGLQTITAPVIIYNNLLVGGANLTIGYLAQLSIDLQDAYDRGLLQAHTVLQDFINDFYPSSSEYPLKDNIMSSSCGGNIKLLNNVVKPSSSCSGGSWYSTPPVSPYFSCSDKRIVYYFLQSQCSSTDPNSKFYKSYGVYFTITTNDVNWPLSGHPVSLPNTDVPAFAQSLSNNAANNQNIANALKDVIAANPSLVDKNSVKPISASDIKAYAQSVANTAVNDKIAAIQAALAADPTNASLQVELAKAINDAIQQSAEQIAEQAKPPEPNYPVPSTWYTGKCNSLDIPSCFNYQPVLDATDSFKNTAIYQAPNLVLKCLDYVKGDGCEYPPRISINLFSRYSSEQTNIDLTPFQSAVKVMKFFFSLLCFICTYKAVMTLFR